MIHPFPASDGENNKRAKLTWAHVRHLRSVYEKREVPTMVFCKSWGALLGITPAHVGSIVRRITWRD